MRLLRYLFVALMLMTSGSLIGQDVRLNAGFLEDSAKIGEGVRFYMSAHYPSDLTILFPDSSYSYAPFEYNDREYFPTKTTDGMSADSAIYFLTTFEIDRAQALSLPVYVITGGDSSLVQAPGDTLLITQLIAEVPDTVSIQELPLKMNTAYEKVSYHFNVWLVAIIISILLCVAAIVWLAFGKTIRRYFKAKRMQKNHATFLETYNKFLRQLQSAFSPPATESALFTWKRYMEQLEARPYTKLTTRETLRMVKEPALSEHLGRIDRAIYGNDRSVVESLENLKTFADQQFRKKLREVKHGK